MAPRPTPRSRSALPRVGAALCALGLPLTLGACTPAPVDEAPAPAPAASGTEVTEAQADALASFSLRLFDALEAESGPNAAEGRLASPLSVEYALAMTANGAEGQTRAQMEATLGMPVDQLNECLHAYAATLQPDGGSEAQEAEGAEGAAAEETLRLANSLWIRDGLTVKEPFLQACGRWYDAEVIQAPFDASTPGAVNDWVSRNTDGMIERIVDEADPLSVMLLVNAAGALRGGAGGGRHLPQRERNRGRSAAHAVERGAVPGRTWLHGLPQALRRRPLRLRGAAARGGLHPRAAAGVP